jgi:hypothetical protein
MAKARVRTKTGATVVVEGTATEVSKIMAAIEQASLPNKPTRQAGVTQAKTELAARAGTSTARILDLKSSGYFDKPRTLSEVASELEKRGFLYPITTLSGIMLGFVQRRLLTRTKRGKVWVYGKR